ncbi:hypothetical protein V1477_003950 [Vespula maculifrons]|uniref:Uncharacterized protein n=1 Tax=Vespula maculifrons TaxID=7453 RepID=A0ABD2CSI9_VESMC
MSSLNGPIRVLQGSTQKTDAEKDANIMAMKRVLSPFPSTLNTIRRVRALYGYWIYGLLHSLTCAHLVMFAFLLDVAIRCATAASGNGFRSGGINNGGNDRRIMGLAYFLRENPCGWRTRRRMRRMKRIGEVRAESLYSRVCVLRLPHNVERALLNHHGEMPFRSSLTPSHEDTPSSMRPLLHSLYAVWRFIGAVNPQFQESPLPALINYPISR